MPEPGWFPDPTNADQSRWWDGHRWTDEVSRDGAVVADPMPRPAPPRRRRGLPWWAWALIGVGALLLLIFLSPIFAFASLVVLVTAIVALTRNTPTWLRLRSRTAAGVVSATALVVLLVSGSVSAAILPGLGRSGDLQAAPAPSADPVSSATAEPAIVDDPAPVAYEGETATVADLSATSDLTASAVLETLPIKGRAPKTGYDRDRFGGEWVDIDRNGCDTRNDILFRDLAGATLHGACTVLSGTLADPYTGTEIAFLRGETTSAQVQIDHVVALGDAWQKGAQGLTPEQRIMLANDPMNLLAVSGQQNEQKGDGDAATWLPRNREYRCEYVARQVSVKATYGLWMTQAEHDAIATILGTCPAQSASTSFYAAAPVASAAPEAPVTAPEAKEEAKKAPKAEVKKAPKKAAEKSPEKKVKKKAPVQTSYANCAAVRAAGKAPLHRGEPGYAPKLDRDGDGIACE